MFTIANVRPFGTNVGNHAIHFSLRNLLYEAFGRLVSIVDIPAGGESGNSAGVGLSRDTVHRVNRFADGVIVGGGNLYENDGLVLDPEALRALQPPLMLFSNSWGRIYDRFEKLSVRSDSISESKLSMLLERADISLSRDSSTHSLAYSLNQKDQLGWCPTVAIGRYAKLLPNLPKDEEVGALISVRTPELMNVPYRHQNRVFNIVRQAIEHLRDAGHKRVRILCNDSRDLEFATAFRSEVGTDALFAGDVYEYLSLLKNASIMVSFRLHATLPALALGTPVVNVTYDERAESLLGDLRAQQGSVHLVFDKDDFDNRLRASINRGGYTNPKSTEDHWKSVIEFQLDSLRDFKNLIGRYLAGGALT